MDEGLSRGSGAILQVLPPTEGGVRDFALALQARWSLLGQTSRLLVLSSATAGASSLTREVRSLASESGRSVTVLLHFSGYGYGRRGLCFWLAAQLRQLRLQHPTVRQVVVFHELFASGPPWKSAFWLAGLQRSIARRIVRLADAAWTNTEAHGQWISRCLPPNRPLRVRPVFCNVGEPTLRCTVAQREATMVVFGAASTRARAVRLLARAPDLLQRLGLRAVIEVGPGPRSVGPLDSVQHIAVGRLPPGELSVLLQRSLFGLIDYPPPYLAKSSVLATYATHGCVVVNTCCDGPDSDGLRRGEHYLPLQALRVSTLDEVRYQGLADSLHRWYDGHALHTQASELLGLAYAD